MRGKLARLFAILTLLLLIACLCVPWFKWERQDHDYIPTNGEDAEDSVKCWVDGTCRSDEFIFKVIEESNHITGRISSSTLL